MLSASPIAQALSSSSSTKRRLGCGLGERGAVRKAGGVVEDQLGRQRIAQREQRAGASGGEIGVIAGSRGRGRRAREHAPGERRRRRRERVVAERRDDRPRQVGGSAAPEIRTKPGVAAGREEIERVQRLAFDRNRGRRKRLRRWRRRTARRRRWRSGRRRDRRERRFGGRRGRWTRLLLGAGIQRLLRRRLRRRHIRRLRPRASGQRQQGKASKQPRRGVSCSPRSRLGHGGRVALLKPAWLARYAGRSWRAS